MIWELLVQLAAAFGATVGFAVLVNAPPREFVWAGVTGAVGWGCYWLYLQWQPSVAVASLLASLMLALLSRVFSVVRRCPATVFLISGIFALVPGAGIYYTAHDEIIGGIVNARAGHQREDAADEEHCGRAPPHH